MNLLGKFFILSVLAFLLVLADSQNAYAYIDPSTGSYVLQFLIAGLFGALFALKIYWQNVKSFVVNIFSGREKKRDDIAN